MTVWYKQGVMGDLQPVAQKGLGRISRLVHTHGEHLYVTSIREANHSAGSLHYIGMAFDIIPSDAVGMNEYRNALGPDWDVVDEGNHIHCEYDPK
uniref:Peptidase n=1 Tax=viral metagenome TaxID=1070528 RepID=A0A6M3IX10_9ZZZZ